MRNRIGLLLLLSPALVAAQAGAGQWPTFTLGGFTVSLPAEPKPIDVANMPAGTHYWAVAQGTTSYVFGVSKIKEDELKAPVDKLLADCIAGLINSTNGTITGERDLTFEGWAGVEILYKKDGGAIGRFRAFVVGSNLVTLGTNRTSDPSEPAGILRYLGSVKLPNDISKGPLKVAGPEMETFDLESSGFTAHVPKGARHGTMKLGEGATAVDLHRFAVAYLNRVYMGIIIDPPPDAKKDIDSDTTGKPAYAVNDTVASLFGGKISKTDTRKMAEGTCWTGDFELGHGLTGHLETYVRNNHTYTLLAVAPQSLFPADEVKQFFDQVTLPKKQD
jgi:hypothetical protein